LLGSCFQVQMFPFPCVPELSSASFTSFSQQQLTMAEPVQCGLFCIWRSVDQFIMVTGAPLGPVTRFYLYPFLFFVVRVGRPLWWEDGSVTCSAIGDWTHNHTLRSHMRLLFSFCRLLLLAGTTVEVFLPAFTDVKRLKQKNVKVKVILWLTISRPVCLGVRLPSGTHDQFFSFFNYF
jgi:hypothetical protein